jgi:uroporphyrin-III C-methyltransferase
VNPALLKHAPYALKIYAGKRSGGRGKSQDEINKMIVDYATEYGHVVRLKGGDPFVFGRGSEEMEYARKHGLKTALIPGITSAVSVPALSGIPLTKRGVSESFWVMTGSTQYGDLCNDLELAARSDATVVILMGLGRIREIMKVFIRAGKASIPVAIIENGSLPSQRMISGTSSDIHDRLLTNKLTPPAIIIIGEVVREPEKLKLIRKEFELS